MSHDSFHSNFKTDSFFQGGQDPAFTMYVDLMARCLIDLIYGADRFPAGGNPNHTFDHERRERGFDWPLVGHSMAGLKRLHNVAELTDRALQEGVPGDFIETGVWRGGASAMMRGVLKARGITDRLVYLADSFKGLPPPNAEEFPEDANSQFHLRPRLAIGLDEVKRTFEAYGFLDEQVRFVEGWFKDTLHKLDAPRFALIRLDGDMYESTIQALTALYPKLSPGGFVILDDYGAIPSCRQATHDYREAHGIKEEIVQIDHTGVWWQKGF